jgi:signal transduction histidine kinase
VLTTLLAAADARTGEAMEVAARMAKEAIGHLEASDEPVLSGEVLGLPRLSERIVAAARAFSSPFEVTASKVTEAPIPATVADALHAAAVQAMVNSTQHAGSLELDRRSTVTGLDAGGVEIVVSDNGNGFDPATVAPERLGLRVSIYERVASVGGESQVISSPGRGTTVVLRWPSADAASDASEPNEGMDGS